MGVTRHGWRKWALAAALSIAALCVVAEALAGSPEAQPEGSAAGAALAGQYRHSMASLGGKTRRSVATIAPRGAGFSIAWEEDEGNLFGGIAVSLDGVIGAAYTEALNGSFRGKGVLAYRISGGTLEGIRLSSASPATPIQETLEGSAVLEGRYAIARSEDAAGNSFHSGHVEIVRDGDTYQMTWYTPTRSDEGVGLRIGDVLVASYGSGFAPGIIAYCADSGRLTGVVTFGHVGTVGPDSMVRVNDGGGTGASTETSQRCRAAIDRWNPTLDPN